MKRALLVLFLPITPVTAEGWKPVADRMLTRWGKSLDASRVWAEHPNPQLQRDSWTNLNGSWDYAILPKDHTVEPDKWDGKILVPFAPEAALSGVGRLLEPGQSLWYRRPLTDKPAAGWRTMLRFEAVDYQCTAWVNGREVGSHTGGFLPFAFDITDALKSGGNELVVRVTDATGGLQLHGKQKLDPGGIWYTRVSGIWQTVWLEQVPERHIEDLDFSGDIRAGTLRITANLKGGVGTGERIRATASIDGKQAADTTDNGEVALLKFSEPRLWSPDSPNLYELTVELLNAEGKPLDKVRSHAALREYGKTRDADGHLRFTLNGRTIFHWGTLDQGWWPDGLLTPPSDEAMVSDIRFLKDVGFNMTRKHIKVEPRRYYWHCDRLGLMMWQDQVSAGYGDKSQPEGSSPPWTRFHPDPKDGIWPDAAHQQWLGEYKNMVRGLRDTACVAVWVPFNEAWGQHRSMEVGAMAAALDPTRHINLASGGNFWPAGDIADHHNYPDPWFPFEDARLKDMVKVVGEFGGHGWPVKGHLWDESKHKWGYGGLPKTLDEWKQRYTKSLTILADLQQRGISAGVYTQTTDVEGEINGLLTYDREPKVEPAWLKEQARVLKNR